MTPQQAWIELSTRPAEFLRHYPLKLAGSTLKPNNAVQSKDYGLHKREDNAKKKKLGHLGATRPKSVGPFTRQANISSFYLRPTAGIIGGTVYHGPIDACYIPMVNYNSDAYGCVDLKGNVTNLPYCIADHSGDGLLATGQLSGCCFAWRVVGAALHCAHVNPAGGDGVTLHNNIAANGTIAGAGGLQTFGRNDYPGVNATVIGIRLAGVWNLFAQTSQDGFATITGARRLHPNPVVL